MSWITRSTKRREIAPAPIGLPRALIYYLHPALWETFFREAGFPVVVSAATDRHMVERAGLVSEPEHCLPVKMLDAHLDSLTGKVDRVFVPRILSTRRGHIACPKLSALPDAVQAQFGDRFQVLTTDVDEGRVSIERMLERLGRRLDVSGDGLRQAIRCAVAAMTAALQDGTANRAVDASVADKRFLLIGHPYNIHDDYMAGPVRRKLERLGMTVERLGFERDAVIAGPVQWDTCSVMLEKLRRMQPGAYAGVIALSSFNCGCDSIVGNLLRAFATERQIPFMTLVLDEHSAQAGLDTRLEAFVDSIGARS